MAGTYIYISDITGSGGSGGSQDLEQVLDEGNTTGGNDIQVSSGDAVAFSNGGVITVSSDDLLVGYSAGVNQNGSDLLLEAQDASNGGGGNGGNLVLTAGSGDGGGSAGVISVQSNTVLNNTTVSSADGYTRIADTAQIGGVVKIAERSALVNAQSGYGKIAFLAASGDGYQLPRAVLLPNDGYSAQVIAPYADYDFSRTTTSATPLQMLNLSLSDNTLYTFAVRIVARQNSSTNILLLETAGLIDRISGGAATIRGTLTNSNYIISDATWGGVSITASGNSLLVTVTGKAATTIRWRLQVYISSIAYP